MTPDEPQTRMTDEEREEMVQALLMLARDFGVPPDVQEVLIQGNALTKTKPGALMALLRAARTRSEPPMVDRLNGMIDLIAEWLAVNAPFCRTEQAHTTEGSRERAYWHHGYLTALRDAKRNLFEKETRQ